MTGELLAIGANHKTAPLPLREKLALPDGRAARVLAELVGHDSVHEAVAISTCNRTELYLVTGDPVEAESVALGILSRQAGLRLTELLGAIYSLRGSAAVNSRLVSGPVVPAPSAVSYARLTWPCTSDSPTIIDSSPPVTAKRCSTAALPRRE